MSLYSCAGMGGVPTYVMIQMHAWVSNFACSVDFIPMQGLKRRTEVPRYSGFRLSSENLDL